MFHGGTAWRYPLNMVGHFNFDISYFFMYEPGKFSRYSDWLHAGRPERHSPAGARDFSLLHRIQTGSGAHPASYPVGTGDPFLGIKKAGKILMLTYLVLCNIIETTIFGLVMKIHHVAKPFFRI
jgi:hypothetical protein